MLGDNNTLNNPGTTTTDSREDNKVYDIDVRKKILRSTKQTKLTFGPAVVPAVRENIRMFQQLSEGSECRFGSGSCATHNVKLCRSVVEKKTSCVDVNGKITWKMREVATLACPRGQLRSDRISDVTRLDYKESGAGTNKKPRLFYEENNDQPQA